MRIGDRHGDKSADFLGIILSIYNIFDNNAHAS